MKIKRLLSLAMLCVAWVGSAWADTTLLTEANGWQKVTDLSTLTLSDYYFAFVDNDKDLMLSFEEGVDQSKKIENKTMVYRTGARAEMTPAMLWVISETPDNAMIRSVVSNLFMQCETDWNANPAQLQPWYCHTNDVSSNTSGGQSWARWGFTYADGSWTIENKKIASNYIGPWTNGAFQNGMQVAGNKTEAAHIGHFQIYAIKRSDVDWLAAASQSNPANISYKITNANAGFKGTSGWSTTGPTKRNDNNGFDLVGGFLEFWSGETWSGSFSQDISNLSSGKYRIRVAGQQSASGVTSTLTAGTGSVAFPSNGTSNGNILASGEETTDGNGTLGWRYVTTETYVTDGNLTIKIESEGGNGNWANFDNVELYYFGNGVELVAEAKNAGEQFTTVAGQWYVIPVATDGDYVFTVGDGSNVTYTQKGNTPESGTFSTATSSVAYSLTKGYVYLKTETATNVNFDASSYTYTVGEATADVSCIQPGKTVTISYNKAVTNDPNATFEKLGTVTFNGTTITPVLSGTSFTFTVPEGLETSKAYTLSIPAGAFGYDGGATCSAQEITFNTPAVFDGKYFIKATDATYGGKYISRGADSNTEAALDLWGLPVKVTTDANNVSTLYFVDNNKPLVLNADNIAYTDGNLSNANHKYTYTIAAAEGGCTLYNIDKTKFIAAGVRADNEVAMASDAAYSWQFVTPTDHTTEMTALKNSQAETAATSAKLSASTVDELKTIVEEWQGNTTENLTLADPKVEFYSDANNQGKAVGTYSKTVKVSKPGLYKFSMPAFTRASGADAAYDNHLTETEALVAYIFFGDYKTQIRSLYSEEGTTETSGYKKPANATDYWANKTTTGDTEFSAGKYANEIWMYLQPGEYDFGITNNSKGLCESWTYFNAPTLTYYSNKFEAGTDVTTTYIKNPDFETGNTDNWTIGVSTNDAGARETSNDTYAAQGSEGNYLFNIWSDGGALTQNIGTLPAGIYQLSAMLATGDSKTLKGTVYLTVNEAKSQGMVSRNGNKKVMHKETLTFVSDGTAETTIGAIGQELGNGGHWWYKADAFKLVFVEDTENLFSVLTSTLEATKPWTTEGDYYNKWNTYSAYTSSNTQAEILAAINYLNTEYDNYKWENASEEHPYIMENVIKNADHRENTNWTGSTGRLTKNINDHWSGGESIVFMANTSGYIRNQTVTVPYEGKYILKTAVRTLTDGAWASIKMGDVENKTETKTGNTGGDVNIDGTEGEDNRANGNAGYGWTFNKVEYISTAENSQTSIGISLSKVNDSFVGLEAQTAGMFLCYVGDKFDYTKDGAHYYHGDWATGELSKELTDDVPVLDLTNATVTGDVDITATNPNGLVYTKTGNAITGITNNVVVDGTCDNLVLTDGHPFKATKQFTATNASYNMTAVAGGKFGTLMLPFAVTTLPGKAYSLDQGVTYGGDIYATEVNAIAANSPVLVTATGEYTATDASVAATVDTYTNGELVGTYKAMTAEENTFVLQKHGDYVAFFMVKDTKPTVNPFRAYIKAQNGAASKEFVNVIFDGNTTGISNVNNQGIADNDIIYDLSGRRVNNARKGVYIINGKKIVK